MWSVLEFFLSKIGRCIVQAAAFINENEILISSYIALYEPRDNPAQASRKKAMHHTEIT
jgi:hypothetical protein